MNDFPKLATNRLVLRQLRNEDAGDVFHYFAQDEVTQYYDLASFTEQRQAEELIEQWNDRFRRSEGIRWGITLMGEDRIIGTCGFHSWSKEHNKSEIGYELAPEYWRQGLMSEALAAVIAYGFEELKLNRIEALIDPDNISSRKLLVKSGLREEGLLRDYYFEKGQYVDAVMFSILHKEYTTGG
ncbi:ribosomal-protein-alanine N-acetyltransferase [Paenibacillus cellulosilyticus]|uniref:Ribosomal-protein-alanine N-acetyltransferase n=1 Tax=Paenibacillus cellulosilyticus TaxID=375489 RepID=A0A2V2YLY8_9BACL|nr:GNAT family protein [Paenibacillus cellulosilyticus]PWV94498.1 ribosomal-protein-alanine N-acetyltransferase [Paenibacillus cellulosilyticus]QKS45008.1 GNAT family N-acetyltransferase [Paenibacillus cellulosilyticus]